MSTTTKENIQPPKLALNRIEAAQALGCSPATLDRLTIRGLLRPCRATYRPIYWVKELERFLKENSVADYIRPESSDNGLPEPLSTFPDGRLWGDATPVFRWGQ